MDLNSWRQRAALGVLIGAAVCALATSYPVVIARSVEGTMALGPSGGQFHATLSISRAHVEDDARITVTVRHTGLGGATGQAPIEGNASIGDPPDVQLGWSTLPITLDVRAGICSTASGCLLPISVGLRSVIGEALPVTVRWRVDALLYPNRNVMTGFDVVASDPSPAASLNELATYSFLTGAGLGVLLGLALLRVPRRRRIRLFELGLTAGLWAAGLVQVQGAVGQGLPVLGAALAVVTAAIATFYARSGPRTRIGFVALSLLGSPLMLAALARDGAFRPIDVTVWFCAAGACLGAGLLIAGWTLRPTVRRRMRRRALDRPVVLVLSVVLLALICYWMFAVAGGLTRYAELYLLPVVFSCAGLAYAIWRWLNEDSIPLAVMAVLLPILAVLGFYAAGLYGFPFGGSADPEVSTSLGAICLGGVWLVLAIAFGQPRSRYAPIRPRTL